MFLTFTTKFINMNDKPSEKIKLNHIPVNPNNFDKIIKLIGRKTKDLNIQITFEYLGISIA